MNLVHFPRRSRIPFFELSKSASFENSEEYIGFPRERNVRLERDVYLLDDRWREDSFHWNSF